MHCAVQDCSFTIYTYGSLRQGCAKTGQGFMSVQVHGFPSNFSVVLEMCIGNTTSILKTCKIHLKTQKQCELFSSIVVP